MSRYIVVPEQTRYGITYAVMDTATGKAVTQYGCDLWAQHRADELNGKENHESNTRRTGNHHQHSADGEGHDDSHDRPDHDAQA